MSDSIAHQRWVSRSQVAEASTLAWLICLVAAVIDVIAKLDFADAFSVCAAEFLWRAAVSPFTQLLTLIASIVAISLRVANLRLPQTFS
jgi:hypothetical protein